VPTRRSDLDAVNFYRGERLPVPHFTAIAFAAFELENQYLGRFGLLDDVAVNGGVFDKRLTDLDGLTVGIHQDVKRYGRSHFAGQFLNPQGLTRLRPVLFSA
jgi:hypothetical protein